MTINQRLLARSGLYTSLGAASLALFLTVAFLIFDRISPPPTPDQTSVSRQVLDTDGHLLRAFATKGGRWRLPVKLSQIDDEYLKLLIAYEDKRFWRHSGVDPIAMGRAVTQFVRNGRIVSGGSTITMQLARLLEPRAKRSLSVKLFQIARALQLERRFSKTEILQYYLQLAPYGGNLEGVRAGSLAYFGKEPKSLSLSQAALLVALPQAPEGRRPDRSPNRALMARNNVLKRMASLKVISASEVARASRDKIGKSRRRLPHLAAHLAQRAVQQKPDLQLHTLTIKKSVQKALETVAREAIKDFDRNVSIAMILVDAKSGNIVAEIGAPDYLDRNRSGWIDMTRAIRSPGSTLKPFIYGLAFEEGLAASETLITDRPANFGNYRPQNFDLKYQGEVSVKKALQLSLNVPAIHLLEAVGPSRLMSRFDKVGVSALLPNTEKAGLSIGLGGVGISLRDLTRLYQAFVTQGAVPTLKNGLEDASATQGQKAEQLLSSHASWEVSEILAGHPLPSNTASHAIAYKTGTSYGYRDAWSVGFDGRYVLGVWVGRPDNGPVPGITGIKTAAPILFEAFARSGLQRVPFQSPPTGAVRATHDDLPITLKRFEPASQSDVFAKVAEHPPRIIYPPEGARIELAGSLSGAPGALVMKLQEGRPPFKWLANGQLLPTSSRSRTATWKPDSEGYSQLTVIDAVGRATSVNVFLELQR